ncbi:hypothetical protein K438DRAFT_1933418 [Mycena galopus ATCC 62051]|nr:hypothetical protein K438DRAFT_1933418 [Mycena galopus ATCC 62051]
MAGSLPADVLVELFRLLPEPETLSVHGLFNLAGVNQAWRAAALSCGTLWSSICTVKQRDRRLLPLLLERSRTAPLHVRLDLFCSAYGIAPTDTTSQERAAVVEALLPHVYRIQKLYIRHMLLEPETEDAVTLLKLVDAGLEFTTLREYTHEHMGQIFRPSAESDSPLTLTAPNLRALSLNGTRPRAWPTLLARTLVELDITAKGTPLDMDLIATIFQQCPTLTSLTLRKGFHSRHPPLSSPVSHPRFVPPPSLRVLDLHMPMPEILAVLRLFSHAPPLHSITVCDDKGLRPRDGQTTFAPTDHPILDHMIAGLAPLVAFEVHSDQDVILRDASGRMRCFRVDAEDDACLDTRALWVSLVARCGARRTVRTLLGTAKAWSSLTRAFAGAPRPDPHPHGPGGGLELRMRVDPSTHAPFPLTLPALRKLTLHPAKHASGVSVSVKGVLAVLSMVRTRAGSVVVCLGEVPLDVPPRRYLTEFAHLSAEIQRAGAGASVGSAGDPMWVLCAHCVGRAEATADLGRWMNGVIEISAPPGAAVITLPCAPSAGLTKGKALLVLNVALNRDTIDNVECPCSDRPIKTGPQALSREDFRQHYREYYNETTSKLVLSLWWKPKLIEGLIVYKRYLVQQLSTPTDAVRRCHKTPSSHVIPGEQYPAELLAGWQYDVAEFPEGVSPSQNVQYPESGPGCVVVLYPHKPAVLMLSELPGIFSVIHCALAGGAGSGSYHPDLGRRPFREINVRHSGAIWLPSPLCPEYPVLSHDSRAAKLQNAAWSRLPCKLYTADGMTGPGTMMDVASTALRHNGRDLPDVKKVRQRDSAEWIWSAGELANTDARGCNRP